MSKIKFYLDEDVQVQVSTALRENDFDAVTTKEADMLKASDTAQLQFAAKEKRSIVTYNWVDFINLHNLYLS